MRPSSPGDAQAAREDGSQMTDATVKPHLSLWRVLQMNLGFFGLQFSFGLQQGQVAPIYSYLGAHEAQLPFLQLAGPLSGLIVQPIIGALSDRTLSRWGRRTPYFVSGAVMCAVGLFVMPFSNSLMMAASMLWLMDIGNNTTMEPYRAYVSDRLNPDQHSIGFLSQSAFTGLAQMLSFVAPLLLVFFGMNKDAVDAHNIPYTTHIAFTVGAVLSFASVMWSVFRVPELPLTPAQRAEIEAAPRSAWATFKEIWDAIVDMPTPMRKLAVMSLFQWYGFGTYWTYVIYSIGRSVFHTAEPNSPAFHDAVLANGAMAAFYNGVAFAAAFATVKLTNRFGPKRMHALWLICAGIGMLCIPHVQSTIWLYLPAIGVGLGWASIMGNPYVMLAGCIPPARTGVYMGIFNMMIVIPMLLNGATMWFIYPHWLNNDPRNALTLAGVLLVCAALAVLRVKDSGLAEAAPGEAPQMA